MRKTRPFIQLTEYFFFGNTLRVYPAQKEGAYTIPDGIVNIGSYAFAHNAALTDVVIPDSVKFIRPLAFDECTSLETISIPENVMSIGKQAFLGCTNLKEINVDEKTRIIILSTACFSSKILFLIIP